MRMKKTNIMIRTIGGKNKSNNIGLGHIHRITNLLENFNLINSYCVLEDFGNAEKNLNRKKFKEIIRIKKKINVDQDIEITKKIIQEKNIDLIIVDKFPLNHKYTKEIKKMCKLVIISDLKNIEYDADLIINGFIGYKNKSITNSKNVKCLLGPKFQIINKKFQRKSKVQKKYDLLVTLGGSNEKKIIKVIRNIHKKMGNILKIKIILGPAYIDAKKISKQKNLKIIEKTCNMKKEIESAKFGICGGGITTYEFASMKIPFAIVSVSRHQLITARKWEKYGMKNLGAKSSVSEAKIEKIMLNLANTKKFPKSQIKIDGKGGIRVTKEIMKLISNN